MTRTMVEVDALQEYLRGVLDRASHHAGDVRGGDPDCRGRRGAF
jgi:hypothetical protein